MAQELHPPGEVAVDRAGELRLCGVPLLTSLEGNVGCCVVHDREGGHPEVVTQPRHEPVLHDAKPAKVGNEQRESCRGKRSTAEPGCSHTWHLVLLELTGIKVPDEPVEDRGKELQGRTQEALDHLACMQTGTRAAPGRWSEVLPTTTNVRASTQADQETAMLFAYRPVHTA